MEKWAKVYNVIKKAKKGNFKVPESMQEKAKTISSYLEGFSTENLDYVYYIKPNKDELKKRQK